MTLQSRVRLVRCVVAALSLRPLHSVAQTSPPCGGRAVAVRANAGGMHLALAATGALPATGGALQTARASVEVLGLLPVDARRSATSGRGHTSQAPSAVVPLHRLAGRMAADVVQSHATAPCSSAQAHVSGQAALVGRVGAGQPVLTGPPHIASALPGGIRVISNAQTSSPSGGTTGTTTVNAGQGPGPGIDSVVASSEADLTGPE